MGAKHDAALETAQSISARLAETRETTVPHMMELRRQALVVAAETYTYQQMADACECHASMIARELTTARNGTD